ncbi:MAG: hypothetical protein GY941_25390 [Planctomycetes bacterium]|nr:hypothetical protein [Planctomycetota bacterium]
MTDTLDKIRNTNYDAIVVGSGFGGAVAITKFGEKGKKILVLERGTWWGNPEGPGLKSNVNKKITDPEFKDKVPGLKENRQWWPRPNDSQGLVYLINSIYKEINPVFDFFNPFVKDNDLGMQKNRNGLFRLTRFSHKNGNVDVVSGNGVGGGSLFYSGVNLIPRKVVLERIGIDYLTDKDFQEGGKWMNKYRGRINKVNTKVPVPHAPGKKYQLTGIPVSVENGSETANEYEMPDPDLKEHDKDYLHLDRARVLKRAKERVEANNGFGYSENGVNHTATVGELDPLPLSVVEYDPEKFDEHSKEGGDSDKKNAFCLREGRCIVGCLPSARHTIYKTIQKRIKAGNDITVLPQTKVSHIDRTGEKYVVHFESFLEDEDGVTSQATSENVFVTAGCLGTNEIMLRTKLKYEDSGGTEGLSLSNMVGSKFSTNADFFAFTTQVDEGDQKEEAGKRLGKVNPTFGPINSSSFHLIYDKDDINRRVDIHVEDAGIPTLFARIAHTLIPNLDNWGKLMDLGKAMIKTLLNKDPFSTSGKPDTTKKREENYMTERELISDMFFFNTTGAGPDEPYGRFILDSKKQMQLEYEDGKKLGDWTVFTHINTVLRKLANEMGVNAKYVKSPFWEKEQRVSSVHPLGGCTIGSDRMNGTVDEFGRVFDASAADAKGTHKGIYIVDAAAIPGALGVNPTFTIVAQAVRAVDNALNE